MAIVKNIELKCAFVLDQLPENYSKEDFVELFIVHYPTDYKLIQDRYIEHQKKSKGKWHPCPHPRQYILNVSYKFRNIK